MFRADPVPDGDLVRMLDAARMAPSGGNLQPWHFLVVRTPSKIERIREVITEGLEELPRQMADSRLTRAETQTLVNRFRTFSLFFAAAPTVILALMQQSPFKPPLLEYLTGSGRTTDEAEAELGFVEVQGVAAAIENLLLTAHALGYGACWMNIPFFARKGLYREFDIQAPWDLLAMVPVGLPDRHSMPSPGHRKPLDQIVTFV